MSVSAELWKQHKLNRAVARRVSECMNVPKSTFKGVFDRPVADGTKKQTFERWLRYIDGDFFWLGILHGDLVIVFGDVIGHHAYACGLKAQFLVAIEREAERLATNRRVVRPDGLMLELLKFFLELGRSGREKDWSLDEGIDLVVMIIRQSGRAEYCTSFGDPILGFFHPGLGATSTRLTQLEFSKRNKSGPAAPPLFRFTQPLQVGDAKPMVLRADTSPYSHLILLTDGFPALRRKADKKPLGADKVNEFLGNAFVAASARGGGKLGAITEEFLGQTKAWRKKRPTRAKLEDDRLILVVDLAAIRKHLAAVPPPSPRKHRHTPAVSSN